MIIVPFAHDQPDNAFRCARLGVSRTITRSRCNARTLTGELSALLGNPSYATRAEEVGREVRAEAGAEGAADAIEALLGVNKSDES